MSEHDQKYDLEAQESILKQAIRFDAVATGEASRDELVAVATELGISESAVLKAIAKHDQRNRLKQHSRLSLALTIVLGFQTLSLWAAFMLFLYSRTGPSIQFLACGTAFSLALICGRMAYRESRTLYRLLKVNASLAVVFAGAITFYQMFTQDLIFSLETIIPCLTLWLISIIAIILGAVLKRQGLDPILPKAARGPTEFA